MKRILLAASLLGAASSAAATMSTPTLCRVQARATPSTVPYLRHLSVTLRPGCPPQGEAHVRLYSLWTGATDPQGDFFTLTSEQPSVVFLGVFGHWVLQWRALSGLTYRVAER